MESTIQQALDAVKAHQAAMRAIAEEIAKERAQERADHALTIDHKEL